MKDMKINLRNFEIEELEALELEIEAAHEKKFGRLPDEWVVFIDRKSHYGSIGGAGLRGYRKAQTFNELVAVDVYEVLLEVKDGIVNLEFHDHDGVNYGKLTSSDDLNAEGYDLEDKCDNIIFSESKFPFIQF